MDEKISRLLEWSGGGKAPPLSIELGPTLRCNLNCLFCWRQGKADVEYGEEVGLDRYAEIIEDAAKLGVKEVRIIGGGEPLLSGSTFEIMKRVKAVGMSGYICTNGTMFTKEMIETLVKVGWDHVKVSLHGSCAKTHDHLVQMPGAFEKAVDALATFRDLKGSTSERPYLEIGFVLVKDNYKEVERMPRLARELGVQGFFVEPITVYTDSGAKLKLDERDRDAFVRAARIAAEKSKQFRIETNVSNFVQSDFVEKTGDMTSLIEEDIQGDRNDFFSVPCYEPWYRMGIRADGSVCPCGFLDQGATENIKEKGLKAIWYGEYFRNRRRQLLQKALPEHCKKCCTTLVVNNSAIRNELERHRRAEIR
jgi:radical SAM protein with 4Fe4S-binding SPASM domain